VGWQWPWTAGDSHSTLAPRTSPETPGEHGPAQPAVMAAAFRAVPTLFSFAEPAEALALNHAMPAPTQRIRYVRLNREIFAGKDSPFWQPAGAGRVLMPLPEGGEITVVIDESEMLGADRYTSRGRIEGRPLSQAIFAYNQGFLHVSVDDPALGSFALRAVTEEYSQYYAIDRGLVPGCGGERRPVFAADAMARALSQRARSSPGAVSDATPATAAAENPQRAEVHVMMVYTQAVLPTLTGAARTNAVQSAFDGAIAKVNVAFATSEITARLKLVRIFQTNYSRDGAASGSFPSLQDDALDDLYKTDDGVMDDIHAARDQAGADMVCLTLNRADTLSSGLSFLLDEPGDLRNAMFSFSVVQYSNITGTNVVPHEFGHVFGCAHDRPNARSGPGAYSYSYGYSFVAANNQRYHDIMAYPPGQELSYFSNPRITAPAPAPANSPGGIAAGQPGESDTALTIEQNVFEVSTYRLQTQAAPNPGALINVATLAYSGTDSQVLIGGLVIEGTQPKRVLLRGAGPALQRFGVSGALVDPVLRLFSGSTELATNNNWEVQNGATAAEVRLAVDGVGAFPFAPGSADAALLVTLAPGPYTVWLQGAGGTTGFGLVEGYDVDRNANRIVNLSTRGYADHLGRPITGGFVVQGTPGTTKRILIRSIGPSLARPPFGMTGVMEDPCLEVRNSAGAVLIKNDDWSIGSRVVAGQADDFQPLVFSYSEEHISATGFAPGNRREPCVLVDLPPGAYTVIVKPFEVNDPLDPTRNQEAAPGLVVVEVYEIN
jgi:hypothetical protein